MIDYFFLQKNTDSKIILDLLYEYNDYFIPKISDRTDLEEYAAKLSSNATLLLAKKSDKSIGFAAFYFNPKPNDTYLSLLAVNHSYQKHGIGGSLIQTMIEHCLNNTKGIKLEVRANNAQLIDFYLKRGFEILDQFMSPFNREKKYYLYKKLSDE